MSLYAWKGFSADQLKAIKAPILIAGGDHDLIRVERFAEWSRMIPVRQLAVIPDASHFVLFSEPEKLLPTIAAFLDAPASQSAAEHGTNGLRPRRYQIVRRLTLHEDRLHGDDLGQNHGQGSDG